MVTYILNDKYDEHKKEMDERFNREITDKNFISALSSNKELKVILDDAKFRKWILNNNLTREIANGTIENINNILSTDKKLSKDTFSESRDKYKEYIKDYILVFLDTKDTLGSSTVGSTHICIYDNNQTQCIHNASNNSDIENVLANNNMPGKQEVFICERGMCENSSRKAKGEICCIHKKTSKVKGGKTKKKKIKKRKQKRKSTKKYK